MSQKKVKELRKVFRPEELNLKNKLKIEILYHKGGRPYYKQALNSQQRYWRSPKKQYL
jgi:hypothetical protein